MSGKINYLKDIAEHLTELGTGKAKPRFAGAGVCHELSGRYGYIIPAEIKDTYYQFPYYSGKSGYAIKHPILRARKAYDILGEDGNLWEILPHHTREDAQYIRARLDFCLFLADKINKQIIDMEEDLEELRIQKLEDNRVLL